MPYIKKTPEFEKIEQLAEKIPAPLSWLMPDPYDPASYIMPVAGLLKQQSLRKEILMKLEQLYKGRVQHKGGVQGIERMIEELATGKGTPFRGTIEPNFDPAISKELEKFTKTPKLKKHKQRVSLNLLEPTHPVEQTLPPSQSKGPIEVWQDVETGLMYIEDGHRRVRDALRKGIKELEAIITPVLNRPEEGGFLDLTKGGK